MREKTTWIEVSMKLSPPTVLLINQMLPGMNSSVLHMLQQQCKVHEIAGQEQIGHYVQKLCPSILCFECDYPEPGWLTLVRETKRNYPAIPVLMVTDQSSEALAVWAFRSHVWDYFAKPVAEKQFAIRLRLLLTIIEQAGQAPSRNVQMPAQNLPMKAIFPAAVGPIVMRRVLSHIERNLEKKISQDAMAKACNMSPWKFSRTFKQIYGMTFQNYVMRLRIEEATRLLRDTSADVMEICFATGFGDPSHFTRTFRRHVGVTPSTYRREYTRTQGVALQTFPENIRH